MGCKVKVPNVPPPNIHPCRKLDYLAELYKSDLYKHAVKQLKEGGFSHYRQVRGDGNCYYRAVAYSYIETLVILRKTKSL
mmetsp:Transcript_20286/g.19221  ORF Transcript_20286/g.19221 Transcript_20286/m.19221 type:complete len:80 (-) Transcript_20286:885-1124(-)